MTTIAPRKVVLTCTVTGKQTTWTNQEIIQKKIDEFGSLEAFMAQYVSRGAKAPATPKAAPVVKPAAAPESVPENSSFPAPTEYVTRRFDCGDGTFCTVTAPKPPEPKYVNVNSTSHAASKALAAVSNQ